jgi:hypothetical protein
MGAERPGNFSSIMHSVVGRTPHGFGFHDILKHWIPPHTARGRLLKPACPGLSGNYILNLYPLNINPVKIHNPKS